MLEEKSSWKCCKQSCSAPTGPETRAVVEQRTWEQGLEAACGIFSGRKKASFLPPEAASQGKTAFLERDGKGLQKNDPLYPAFLDLRKYVFLSEQHIYFVLRKLS